MECFPNVCVVALIFDSPIMRGKKGATRGVEVPPLAGRNHRPLARFLRVLDVPDLVPGDGVWT